MPDIGVYQLGYSPVDQVGGDMCYFGFQTAKLFRKLKVGKSGLVRKLKREKVEKWESEKVKKQESGKVGKVEKWEGLIKGDGRLGTKKA